MGFDWQSTTVGTLIVLSLGYLAYRCWLMLSSRQSSGCGSSCSGCDSKQTDGQGKKSAFVPIESLTRSPEQ